MHAVRPGWAEQDPHLWWEHLGHAAAALGATHRLSEVLAVGIAYQMHGLVLVDAHHQPLRPAIIWCDSRAVEIGRQAWLALGHQRCLQHLCGSPGNFTASKLRWVIENEPEIYAHAAAWMLPGDYLAGRLTDVAATTACGLSEAMLWDYPAGGQAGFLLDHYDIDPRLTLPLVPGIGDQGRLTATGAAHLGIPAGTPVAYRAGDQPNNALALNVCHPGEAAATAGTSGVVYGVSDVPRADPASRVNTFVHATHTPLAPRYGVLLCVNGTGILNRWLKSICGDLDYPRMNSVAASAPVGAGGLQVLPFGNGAERLLENRDLGASISGLNFNLHGRSHLLRAGQEGIVFALAQGVQVMREMGVEPSTIRAGAGNMFASPLFRTAFAATTGVRLELIDTDGAEGAARGALAGAGLMPLDAALGAVSVLQVEEPDATLAGGYQEAFGRWQETLRKVLAAGGTL